MDVNRIFGAGSLYCCFRHVREICCCVVHSTFLCSSNASLFFSLFKLVGHMVSSYGKYVPLVSINTCNICLHNPLFPKQISTRQASNPLNNVDSENRKPISGHHWSWHINMFHREQHGLLWLVYSGFSLVCLFCDAPDELFVLVSFYDMKSCAGSLIAN